MRINSWSYRARFAWLWLDRHLVQLAALDILLIVAVNTLIELWR